MCTLRFYSTSCCRRTHSFSKPTFLSPISANASETELSSPTKGAKILHPWPEWTELLQLLYKKGFLNVDALGNHRNYNSIRSGCLDFARGHAHLIRYFSRGDICTMARAGCPSLDRKIVNSGKRLRAHVGVNERDVCNSCNFRGSCQRAYVKARDDEIGSTVDVMRFLLTYGLGTDGGVANKYVQRSVRKLLKEMVEFKDDEPCSSSAEENCEPKNIKTALVNKGDWICPKCNFVNFAKNIKCLCCASVFQERLDKLHEARKHYPLKKGDWICEKCHFFNFAKDPRCLQCNEKSPKRNLNPGEWECESCSYINFRKNMACLKCNWKPPKTSSKNLAVSIIQESDDIVHNRYSYSNSLSEDDHSNFWSCDEDEIDEDHNEISWSKFSDNFPTGEVGRGILKNSYLKDTWRERMLKHQEISSIDMKNNSSVNAFCTADNLEFDILDNSDDDI